MAETDTALLESAVLRRLDGGWRAALLHSTRAAASETPRSLEIPPARP